MSQTSPMPFGWQSVWSAFGSVQLSHASGTRSPSPSAMSLNPGHWSLELQMPSPSESFGLSSGQESPVSHIPSPSVSGPSLAGSYSGRGPNPSFPTEQSSQPSWSKSSHDKGSKEARSIGSGTPS